MNENRIEGLKTVKYVEYQGGFRGGGHQTSAHMWLHAFACYDWETDLGFTVDLRTQRAKGSERLFLWETGSPQAHAEAQEKNRGPCLLWARLRAVRAQKVPGRAI